MYSVFEFVNLVREIRIDLNYCSDKKVYALNNNKFVIPSQKRAQNQSLVHLRELTNNEISRYSNRFSPFYYRIELRSE